MAPGIWQILVVLVLVLLLFGAGRLPRIMEDLAKGIKGFKRGLQDEGEDKPDENLKIKNQDDNKT